MLEQIIDKPYCRKMKFEAGKTFKGEFSLEDGLHVMSLAVKCALVIHKETAKCVCCIPMLISWL